jgi:general secretion pathway protein N
MTACGRWLMLAIIPAGIVCYSGIVAAQTAPTPAPAAQSFEMPPLEQLQATRERPLFIQTRRPPAVVVEPDAPPPITESVALPFELTGVALGDEVRVAILHNKNTNQVVRLREGDRLENWRIEAVAERFILLRGDGRRVRLWLFDNGKNRGVDVRRVDGTGEPIAEPAPDGQVDQEVVPSAAPLARPPAPPPRRPIPMRPDARPRPRRN